MPEKRGKSAVYWTDDEDDILRTYWLSSPAVILSKLRGRTWGGCLHRARPLGLPKRPRSNGDLNWKLHEDEVILDGMVNKLSIRQIAESLPGRNRNMVIGRIHRKRNDWHQHVPTAPSVPAKPVPSPVERDPVKMVSPQVAPALAKRARDRSCASPGCKFTRQPGRDYCASCLTAQAPKRERVNAI